MAETTPTKPNDILKQGVAVAGLRQSAGVTPRAEGQQDNAEGVVIRGLGSDTYIQEAYLILSGYMKDPFQNNTWAPFRDPIMNKTGIGNFIKILHVLRRIEFSNFDKDKTPPLIFNYYRTNIIQFLAYHNEFDLREEDYNVIKTELMYACLAAFHNAHAAGHRNVVRGTMSESVFLKALGAGADGEKKKGLFGFIPKLWGKGN